MGIIRRWFAIRRARASRRPEPEEMPSADSETEVDDKKPMPPVQDPYTIEHLPTEIKRLILLALPKLDDLHAMIRASPVFHQVYVLERSYFLRKSLLSTLGDTWIDAHAAHASGLKIFYSSRSPEEVKLFLSEYQDVRAGRSLQKETLQSLSLEALVSITAFFASTVEPLARVYARWALGDVASTTRHNPLSSNELGRIVRAVYRFQIFCNLFGGEEHLATLPRLSPRDRLRLFLSFYEPWEIEEILCIRRYATETYDSVLADVAEIVSSEGELKADISKPLSYPPGRRDIPNGNWHWFADRNGLVSLGVRLLWTMVRDGSEDMSPKILVKLIFNNIFSEAEGRWMTESTSRTQQVQRRRRWYSDGDAAQDRQEKLSYLGDSLDYPPLAWVILWRGRYSNLYGDYVPDEFRRWGYVMWDRQRLSNSMGKQLLRDTRPRWIRRRGLRQSDIPR